MILPVPIPSMQIN